MEDDHPHCQAEGCTNRLYPVSPGFMAHKNVPRFCSPVCRVRTYKANIKSGVQKKRIRYPDDTE